jgi:serine/threonine protein kinase
VHRDIKPENIMVLKENYSLHRENYVKVLDFGIAKLTETTSDAEAPTKPLIEDQSGSSDRHCELHVAGAGARATS